MTESKEINLFICGQLTDLVLHSENKAGVSNKLSCGPKMKPEHSLPPYTKEKESNGLKI